MSTVLALSGSLRAGSLNSMLLRALPALAPGSMKLDIFPTLRHIPPFDQDHDPANLEAPVAELLDRIAAADGLLIATPEYNYGPPGLLKNAIDWASVPPDASVLRGKPVGLLGASPTNFGTVRAQLSLRQSFLWTDSPVVGKPEVMIFRAHERFDDAGQIADEGTRELVTGLLESLQALIEQRAPAPIAG